MMLFRLSFTVCYAWIISSGLVPNVTISGQTHKDAFQIFLETEDEILQAEFLTDIRTVCTLFRGSHKCDGYNYTLSSNNITLSGQGQPHTDREYGCEIILERNNSYAIIYSSGYFSINGFIRNSIEKTPIVHPDIENSNPCHKNTDCKNSEDKTESLERSMLIAMLVLIASILMAKKHQMIKDKINRTSVILQGLIQPKTDNHENYVQSTTKKGTKGRKKY